MERIASALRCHRSVVARTAVLTVIQNSDVASTNAASGFATAIALRSCYRLRPEPLHSWQVWPSFFPDPLQTGHFVGGFGPCSIPISNPPSLLDINGLTTHGTRMKPWCGPLEMQPRWAVCRFPNWRLTSDGSEQSIVELLCPSHVSPLDVN